MRARYLVGLLCLHAAAASAADAEAGAMKSVLAFFQGHWTCAGVFPASGKTIASTMRFESDLGDAALVKHHDDTSPPALYHAVELWGYSARDTRFNAAILDNFGGARRFASPGWRGDMLVWTSASDVQPTQQFVYARIDADTFRVDWQTAHVGAPYVVGDTLTCHRQR
jgi:hypothetical protein